MKAWLMQQPRPHIVRVTSLDGSINEVICGGPWPKVASTLVALQPELLEAMAPDKTLIRAARPNDQSEDWDDDDTDPSLSPRVPSLNNIAITAADPETQRFALVAGLLAEAYRHSTDVAFNRLTTFLEMLLGRSADTERARDAVYRAQIKALEDQLRANQLEPESSPSDMIGAMLAQFMGGMQQAAPSAPPPPAPAANGKGTNHA